MKKFAILLLMISCQVFGMSTWLEKLDESNKQEQLDLRWIANGGEVDFQFMHGKLNTMQIQLSPQPHFPNRSWSENHLVFSIQKGSQIDLQVPYGNIEQITSGKLIANAQFSFSHADKKIDIKSLTFIPNPRKKDAMDIATFKLVDQLGRHLFNTNNNHIQYSEDKKLLQMKNMDISASKELALLLKMPELENQLVGQVNTYSHLSIPKNAQFETKSGNCLTNPNFQNSGNFTDVLLFNMASIHWVGNENVTGELILVPSAELRNVGTADVPWLEKFTTDYIPYSPEQTDNQHPFLNWAVYREIDNRFEQIGISGLKHAFFSTNTICPCPGGNVLGLGCGDVYGLGSNDNVLQSLGPRDELNAFTGIWESCGSFFDPLSDPNNPLSCSGTQQNASGSTSTGENRLTIDANKIVPNLYMQAWYIVKDDINIFNSMGYKRFSPELINTTWVTNTDAAFSNGAALENYVPKNTISALQSSQTITTDEGHFTVAVKVIDLGGGQFRYNYAVENYDFDPQFIQFHIPLDDTSVLTDTVFVDPDNNITNDWQFTRTNNTLNIVGDNSNTQDWGILFSFSFTTNSSPARSNLTIDVANPVLNQTVNTPTLAPINLFSDGFE